MQGDKDTLRKHTIRKAEIDQLKNEARLGLEELLREGARQMLQQAIENEISEYIDQHAHVLDEKGHRQVVRNGSLPERELITGIGKVRIRQPRVHDQRDGHRFTRRILPPYLRRLPSIDALIPALYLRGVSTGDFTEALEGRSWDLRRKGFRRRISSVSRRAGKADYEKWRRRDLKKHGLTSVPALAI